MTVCFGGMKRLFARSQRAVLTLQRLFNALRRERVAAVAMAARKQRAAAVAALEGACVAAHDRRTLQKVMRDMQFTYALRQLQVRAYL